MTKPPRKSSRRSRFKPDIVSADDARKISATRMRRGRPASLERAKAGSGAESGPRSGASGSRSDGSGGKRSGETASKGPGRTSGQSPGKGPGKSFRISSRQRKAPRPPEVQPASPPPRVQSRAQRAASHTGPAVSEPMRIARAMARAGLCSRREAERWITEGRVSVNGKVLDSPAVEIKPRDRVLIDGQPMPSPEPPRLWRFHKPKGCVTTHHDPEGRETIFDKLPPGLPRVVTIGRLDYNTEGLLLLTNDGALARYIELPETGWLRRYRVRAQGRITQADLDKLKEGVEIDGVRYREVEATLDSEQASNVWLTVGLREGKNREVRRIMASLGLAVSRLIRISFGPFQLLDLKPGEAESVRRKVLADQLGPKLAEEMGLIADEEEEAMPARRGPYKARRRIEKIGREAEVADGGREPAKRPARKGTGEKATTKAGTAEPGRRFKSKASAKPPGRASDTPKGKPHSSPFQKTRPAKSGARPGRKPKPSTRNKDMT